MLYNILYLKIINNVSSHILNICAVNSCYNLIGANKYYCSHGGSVLMNLNNFNHKLMSIEFLLRNLDF